jgi:heparinase II/III-like protein
MPAWREGIISTADAICRGRFGLLGYRNLDFGNPVDWHLDPIAGRRAPLVHWSRLDPLDPAVVGDSKVVWELNRHQWLLQLGQAYRATGDEGYAEVFARSVREWIRANPTGMGINWASSLEVAFRLIAWCWALALFAGSPALSAEMRAMLLAGIGAHARHIERYLSHYFAPNTHLTGEALGLLYAGVLFPELRRARQWQALGTRILVAQCERQIFADGVYFEQSTCYQRYTAEIYLHFLILAARNGIAVPDAVADRLQRLLDFLVAVRRPDGSMPMIGDADGGWLLPLTPRAAEDLRGVMGVAAAFFARSDYAWAADGPAPEVQWLLGVEGQKAFEALTPAPPRTTPSRLFPDGGYAVMQTGWERDAHQLVLSAGRLGGTSRGAHGHADLLGLQCAVFGEPFIIDPGTDGYTRHPEWRDFFRGTAAHSTLRVDGQPQATPAGPFKWASRPRARLRRWLSTETLDLADAEHEAYHHLPDPVTHRRRVIFLKPRYWVVVDDLAGREEHRVEIQFQFAPMTVTVDANLWARACGRRGRGLLMRPFSTATLAAEVCAGGLAPLRGWVSPDYGRRQPAPILTYSAVVRLPWRVVTLLLPVEDPAASVPRVSLRCDASAAPAALAFEDTGETLIVEDGDIRIHRETERVGWAR